MRYVLELKDQSNLFAHEEEQYCKFQSDTPVPVPRVGDRVRFDECRDAGKCLMTVTFVEFSYYPAGKDRAGQDRDALALATVFLVPEGQRSRLPVRQG
jgi:hypothetical protein